MPSCQRWTAFSFFEESNQEARNPRSGSAEKQIPAFSCFPAFLLHLRNPRNPRLLYPTLVEIDQVRNALNVLPISDAHLLFPLFQSRRHEIPPAELGDETIPNKQVALVGPATFFETSSGVSER